MIKIISINTRSFKKRKLELERLTKENSPDIVLLQETMHGEDEKLNLHNYSVYEEPRKKGAGGVAILIKKNMKAFPLYFSTLKKETKIEIIGATMKFKDFKVTFISTYAPPKANLSDFELFDSLDLENSIIGGDFNAHHNQWDANKTDTKGMYLWETIKDRMVLTDTTKSPTCRKIGCLATTPDLVLVGNGVNAVVKSFKVLESIGSDHSPICVNLLFDRAMS